MPVKKSSKSEKSFYITTTLPYINAEPHLGYALELVRADIIARYKKLTGFNVFLNTGTDEHGQKIWRKAQEQGKDLQEFADEYSQKFRNLIEKLGVTEDFNFVRTTDPHHINSAQEFWKRCEKSGDIYKKQYKVKYCVGCELEKTDSELQDGKCPIHPNLEIEIIEEDNYFFKFSKYQNKLLKFYEDIPDFVIPDFRFNEIKRFVERELKDFSISRLNSKMPWGIPVPGDSEHIMYVWFDALVNYVSTIGWPDDLEKFNKWWPPVQYCGKDNLRQQSAMWQAMLMSAGFPQSKQIIIDGFILGEGGVKMSKSLGNVVNPIQIIDEYGTDALRFYLARHIHPFEDSEFSFAKFKTVYNANLANGLGNLVSRIMKMAEEYLDKPVEVENVGYRFPDYVDESMEKYRIDLVMEYAWAKIAELDGEIQEKKPWESKDMEVIKNLVLNLYRIGNLLKPFIPKTAEKIIEAIRKNKKPENLFPRIS